ncbi:hypothetical protein MRX96_019784 [Rhipicephalus microplus]
MLSAMSRLRPGSPSSSGQSSPEPPAPTATAGRHKQLIRRVLATGPLRGSSKKNSAVANANSAAVKHSGSQKDIPTSVSGVSGEDSRSCCSGPNGPFAAAGKTSDGERQTICLPFKGASFARTVNHGPAGRYRQRADGFNELPPLCVGRSESVVESAQKVKWSADLLFNAATRSADKEDKTPWTGHGMK